MPEQHPDNDTFLREIVANHVINNEPPYSRALRTILQPLLANDGHPLRTTLSGLTDNPDFKDKVKDPEVIQRFQDLSSLAMSTEVRRDDGSSSTVQSSALSLGAVGLGVRSEGARRAASRMDYPSRQ